MNFDSSTSDLKIVPVLSTEVKNRLVGPDEMLRVIDTGALYVAGPGGKPQAMMTATATSDGGIVESAGGIKLPPRSVQPDKRPKRWITSDTIPMRTYSIDSRYAYGVTPGLQHKLQRYDYISGGSPVDVYLAGPDALTAVIIFAWAGDRLPAGWVYIAVQNKTVTPNTFQLFRSTDYGVTFAQVLDFGIGAWALDKGLKAFRRNGQFMLGVLEYNVRENFTTRPFDGTANDIVRLWESADGVNFTQVAAWNVGTHHTRHGHCIDVDPYSDPDNHTLFYGFGDADAESALIRRDPGAQWPANMSWSSIAATAGFKVASGSQSCRTVGGIFTADYYITATDQHTGGVTDKANLGVRLWKRDLSSAAHVDRKSGVDSRLVGQNWWFGLNLNNGNSAFLSQPSSSVGTTWRGFGILSSADQLNWHLSGWVTAPAGTTNQNPRVFAQGSNGKIFIGVDVMAGRPSGSGYCTLVCDVTDEDFIESRPDILGPAFFVDHVSGNDANNGLRPNAAWSSVRKALQSSAVTYGSVVRVLRDGDLTEPNTIAVVYNAGSWDATYSGAGPTDFAVQVRGNRSYAATLNWASGTTIIGTGTHRVDIEFDGVGIMPPAATTNWWSSHTTEGLSAYRLKDATFGSKASNANFYLKAGTIYCERATLRCGSGSQVVTPEASNANAKGLECVASWADLAGNSLVTCNHATLFSPIIDQCSFTGYGSAGGVYVAPTSTTKPTLKNCAFVDSYQPAIKDASATAWAGTEIKRSYIGSGVIDASAVAIPTATADASNIQATTSGAMCFGITPVANSPVRSVAAGTVKYDLNRAPILSAVAGAKA